MNSDLESVPTNLRRQRRGLLRRISVLLDTPMTVLSFVWLVLMIVEFTQGLSPQLEGANYIIWSAFVLHFALEFWIAPEKLVYLRSNWLTALALLLPALRMVRVFRVLRLLQTARVSRGVRLLRWVTSLNRGMRATQRTMSRRGLRYVVVLTVLVNFAGAAGVYLFENPQALREAGYPTEDQPDIGIRSYGEGLWWTAMMLTTMGSDYFPKTTEGRIVSLLLAIYAFAIFGYITATVASLIIRVDQDQASGAAQRAEIEALRRQIAELRLALPRREDGTSPAS